MSDAAILPAGFRSRVATCAFHVEDGPNDTDACGDDPAGAHPPGRRGPAGGDRRVLSP